MTGNAFRLTLKLCLKRTGIDYVHSWVAIALPCMTLCIDWVSVCLYCPDARADRLVLCVSASIHCQNHGRVGLLPIKRRGDPPSFIHSFRNVKEVEEGQKVDEMASENTLGAAFRFEHQWSKPRPSYVFPGAASPLFWLPSEDYRSTECALMRVSRVDLSSRHIVSRNCGVRRCVAVICRATMMECLWCWLVWVLLSYSKICDTKKCPASCVQRPFWPLLCSKKDVAKSKSDFSTLCCNLWTIFLGLVFDDTVFLCFLSVTFSISLISQTWLLTPFYIRACR